MLKNKKNNLRNNKVSFLIIIPTLNSFKELNKLVTSLKSQTYKDWKTVFVDGDSGIEHKKWLNSFCSDNRFFLIKENNYERGIYQSMSKGVEFILDNEWVIFMGSDDWFNTPFALEIMAQKISSTFNNNVNLLIYCTQFIHKNNHKILRINNTPPKFMTNMMISNLLLLGYMPTHQSACFSSKIIKQIMPYNYHYKLASDCDLFFRLFKSEFIHIAFIDDILINIQSGGVSSKYTFMRLKEVFLIYYKYYGFFFFFPFLARYINKAFIRILQK